MIRSHLMGILVGLAVSAQAASAESVARTNGGDTFAAGSSYSQSYDAPRDLFVGGNVVTASGSADGDVHAGGFDVDIAVDTRADLYAMGGTITVHANIGEDLTAMGYSLRLSQNATVGGNARMMGHTVTVDGPVRGALSAMGAEVILNAPISGDVWIAAERISFGPNAAISGNLTYASDDTVSIPASVIPADRITVEEWRGDEMMRDVRRQWEHVDMPMMPTFISVFSAFLVSLAFFIAIGAIFLAFTPKPIARMRREIASRPGHIFLLGILGLSMLFGLVPITALTIVGLPFVPIAILLIILAWTLGYILAAYAVAMRVLLAFDGPADPSLLVRLTVLACAVCVVALLNFIPFIGWIVNYTLVLLGIGAMTSALFNWLIGNPGYALDIDMQPIDEKS